MEEGWIRGWERWGERGGGVRLWRWLREGRKVELGEGEGVGV